MLQFHKIYFPDSIPLSNYKITFYSNNIIMIELCCLLNSHEKLSLLLQSITNNNFSSIFFARYILNIKVDISFITDVCES